MLEAVFDRLGSVIVAIIHSAGGKAPDIVPYPRPVTAFQRAQVNRTRDHHNNLVKRLVPK